MDANSEPGRSSHTHRLGWLHYVTRAGVGAEPVEEQRWLLFYLRGFTIFCAGMTTIEILAGHYAFGGLALVAMISALAGWRAAKSEQYTAAVWFGLFAGPVVVQIAILLHGFAPNSNSMEVFHVVTPTFLIVTGFLAKSTAQFVLFGSVSVLATIVNLLYARRSVLIDVEYSASILVATVCVAGIAWLIFQQRRALVDARSTLLTNEQLLQFIADHSSDIISVWSRGALVYNSPAIVRVLGCQVDAIADQQLLHYVHPDDLAEVGERLAALDRNGTETAWRQRFRARHENGAYRWLEAVGGPRSLDESGAPIVVINTRDITETVQIEQRQQASLEEKTVLLREIHHRVKNNLQIVSSLLNIAATTEVDERAVEVLLATRNRVRAMALVHERIFREHGMQELDLYAYVHDLVESITDSYAMSGILQVAAEHVHGSVGLEVAVPLGIILNELITNAIKHAFPDGNAGTIQVSVLRDNKALNMSVHDDGVGIQADHDASRSIGLTLVHTLAEQLGATASVTTGAGTTWLLRIPLDEA